MLLAGLVLGLFLVLNISLAGWSMFPARSSRFACWETSSIATRPRPRVSTSCLLTTWRSWTKTRRRLRDWPRSMMLSLPPTPSSSRFQGCWALASTRWVEVYLCTLEVRLTFILGAGRKVPLPGDALWWPQRQGPWPQVHHQVPDEEGTLL